MALLNTLIYLASYTTYGPTENAAAVYILTKEIERMQKAGEYGLRMPTASEFVATRGSQGAAE